jgi:hypothetical protein
MSRGQRLYNVAMQNIADDHTNLNSVARVTGYFRRQFRALALEHSSNIQPFIRLYLGSFRHFWIQSGYNDITFNGAYRIAQEEFLRAILPMMYRFNFVRTQRSTGLPVDIVNIISTQISDRERDQLHRFLRR